MVKIARNAPCPCGSGKKYKKCCMMKKQAESFTRSLIQQKTIELLPKLLEYTEKEYSEETIMDAWADFYGDDDDDEFDDNPYLDMFYKWFLFFWFPDDGMDLDIKTIFPSSGTVGAIYLRKNKSQLDSLTIRILESALNDPICYWQVIAIEPNRGVLLKDLILGRERFVEEISGSRELQQWDIVLANMQEIDHVFVFNIIAPFMLPPDLKELIMKRFSIDSENPDSIIQLFDIDLDLIFFYQDILEEIFAAEIPGLKNMDGIDLIFTTSTYKIVMSSRKKIIDLISDTENFECIDDENTDRKSFIWIESPEKSSLPDNIIKGDVSIRQDMLVTHCNSAERDNQLRDILLNVLGERIKHHTTESDPIDLPYLSENSDQNSDDPLNLDELPSEVQGQFIENMERMYMKWLDQSIPALDHLTPKEAVKNPEGKKQVIQLINEWENEIDHMGSKQFEFNFNRLRKTLGLQLE